MTAKLVKTEAVVEGRTEVRAPRPHDSGPQSVQRVEYGTEVFRQGTMLDPSPGEGHDGHAVARFARQGIHQALGRLNRRGQTIGNRVFDCHAPTDVDQEDNIVPRR